MTFQPIGAKRPKLNSSFLARAFLLGGLLILFGAGGCSAREGDASKPTPSPTPAGSRVLQFPADRSLGRIKTYNPEKSEWTDIGEAKGKVAVPLGKPAVLIISQSGAADLSPLESLPADAFDQVVIDDLKLPAGAIGHLKSLTMLHKLSLRGSSFPEAELANLKPLEGVTELNFSLSPLGDEGLKHLKGLAKLETLDISSTKVGNGGIPTLKEMKNLRYLDPQKSQIDTKGIEELREALPECLIVER